MESFIIHLERPVLPFFDTQRHLKFSDRNRMCWPSKVVAKRIVPTSEKPNASLKVFSLTKQVPEMTKMGMTKAKLMI